MPKFPNPHVDPTSAKEAAGSTSETQSQEPFGDKSRRGRIIDALRNARSETTKASQTEEDRCDALLRDMFARYAYVRQGGQALYAVRELISDNHAIDGKRWPYTQTVYTLMTKATLEEEHAADIHPRSKKSVFNEWRTSSERESYRDARYLFDGGSQPGVSWAHSVRERYF